ncbi:MAG: dihydroneopterin aldolase, partial [Myxococcota bacterium]|nr:dihydroneopterin aldolase [Myxococcota bacterium]
MRDRVHGIGMAFHCRIGFHEYERHILQKVVVDFEAETDWRESAREDRAQGIVDYYKVNRAIGALIEERSFRLVEALAEEVARLLCRDYPVQRVRVRVTKEPFDMPNAQGVAVECW